jgi:hypothetical protein
VGFASVEFSMSAVMEAVRGTNKTNPHTSINTKRLSSILSCYMKAFVLIVMIGDHVLRVVKYTDSRQGNNDRWDGR